MIIDNNVTPKVYNQVKIYTDFLSNIMQSMEESKRKKFESEIDKYFKNHKHYTGTRCIIFNILKNINYNQDKMNLLEIINYDSDYKRILNETFNYINQKFYLEYDFDFSKEELNLLIKTLEDNINNKNEDNINNKYSFRLYNKYIRLYNIDMYYFSRIK